jgi:hypothetical protein
MRIDFSDCSKLPRGLRKICEKSESVDPETVERYHAAWERRQKRRSVKGPKPVQLRPATKRELALIQPDQQRPCCRTGGPGTELKRLLSELGIPSWCEGCKRRAEAMDQGGVEWCRENRATIVGWLQEAETKFATDAAKAARGDGQEPTAKQVGKAKTAARWRAGWEAAKRMLWINPASPFDSLVAEAIKRAEAKQAESCCEVQQ